MVPRNVPDNVAIIRTFCLTNERTKSNLKRSICFQSLKDIILLFTETYNLKEFFLTVFPVALLQTCLGFVSSTCRLRRKWGREDIRENVQI